MPKGLGGGVYRNGGTGGTPESALRVSHGKGFQDGALVGVLTAEPIDRVLDYKAPEGGVSTGDFVTVPLGPRKVVGVVWGPGEGSFDPAKIRRISGVLDAPPMRPEMREFLNRASDYTLTPLSM